MYITGIWNNVRQSSPTKKAMATLSWQMERIIASFTPQQILRDIVMLSISLVIPLKRPTRPGLRNKVSAQIKAPRFS